jgi:probable phosphoglycerate mutase
MIMNRVFYIFRHGETDWNKEGRCQGHTDTLLNLTGENQASELALKLFHLPLEIIISSDLKRANDTGLKVANLKGIPFVNDSRLREMNYGKAEGLLYKEAIDTYGKELWQKFQTFNSLNNLISFPGGETRLAARERFFLLMLELIKMTSYKTIGLSTHGGALRNLLHSFLPENHQLLPIPNCVAYKCEYDFQTNKFIVNPVPI